MQETPFGNQFLPGSVCSVQIDLFLVCIYESKAASGDAGMGIGFVCRVCMRNLPRHEQG